MTIDVTHLTNGEGDLVTVRTWPRCAIRISRDRIVVEGAELRTQAEIDEFLAQFKMARQDHRLLLGGHGRAW